MSLFALIAALLLEQLHPLSSRKYLHGWLSGYVGFFSITSMRDNTGTARSPGCWRCCRCCSGVWCCPSCCTARIRCLPGRSMCWCCISRWASAVQPLLHRHSSGLARRQAGRGAQSAGQMAQHPGARTERRRSRARQHRRSADRLAPQVFGVIVWSCCSARWAWAARQARCCTVSGNFCTAAGVTIARTSSGNSAASRAARSTCWNGCRSA